MVALHQVVGVGGSSVGVGSVGVFSGVAVGVEVSVGSGTGVSVGVDVSVGAGVSVGLVVGVGVSVGDGVSVGSPVGTGVSVGDSGVAVGSGVASEPQAARIKAATSSPR